MAENETQIDLAADNYGIVYDPGMERECQRGVLGTLGPMRQSEFVSGFQVIHRDSGMRTSLAASLLQGWANKATTPDEWTSIAAAALAAATVIFPKTKEAE